jgi:diguanylate cyclase (GGDEF)-like protein
MTDRTSPQIFEELDDLIKKVEKGSLALGRILRDMRTEELSPETQAKIRSVVERAAHIGELAGPLRATSRELFLKSITDGLTQVRNRGYFEEVIKREIEGIEDAACIMVDIDHFGRYNNKYGHQQGDKALQNTAKTIKECADTEFIARYGGEEFSIILAGYSNSREDVRETAERVRQNIEKLVIPPFSAEIIGREKLSEHLGRAASIDLIAERAVDFLKDSQTHQEDYHDSLRDAFALSAFTDLLRDTKIDGRRLSRTLQRVRKYLTGMQKVTVSVGVATRKRGEDVETLIYHADKALYKAKQLGRNQVCVL